MRWIVIANRAKARFLQIDREDGLKEVVSLYCPEARDRERDAISDDPGRSFDSHGQGSHRLEPKTSTHDHIAGQFAKRIADELESGHNAHRFDELVLVAPPDFLGNLRKALSGPCKQLVIAALSKNIVNLSLPDIEQLLRPRREIT